MSHPTRVIVEDRDGQLTTLKGFKTRFDAESYVVALLAFDRRRAFIRVYIEVSDPEDNNAGRA